MKKVIRLKHVDEYIDELYQNADPRLQETIELKEETRTHLEQSIHDLMIKGHSESDATRIAFNRFGGAEQAESIIQMMQIQQNRFAKQLLQIGFSIAIVSMFLFITSIVIGGRYDLVFANAVYLNTVESSTDEEMSQAILETSRLIHGVTISDYSNSEQVFSDAKRWSGAVGLISNEISYLENGLLVVIDVIDPRKIGSFLLLIGLTIYLVLSMVWGVINLHINRRLNVWSLTLLFLLNVLGYWMANQLVSTEKED